MTDANTPVVSEPATAKLPPCCPISDVTTLNPNTAYYCSPYTKSTGFTRLMRLIVRDPDVDIYDSVCTNHLECIRRYIVLHPEEVNERNTKMWTPLMLAVRNGLTDVVNLLIEHGAKLDRACDSGQTALHLATRYACELSNIEIIRALIKAGANTTLKNNYNDTPLEYALDTEASIDRAVIQLLLSNAPISKGLLYACKNCNYHGLEFVVLVLDRLLDPSHICQKCDIVDKILEALPKFIENRKHFIYAHRTNASCEEFDNLAKCMIKILTMLCHRNNFKRISDAIPPRYIGYFLEELRSSTYIKRRKGLDLRTFVNLGTILEHQSIEGDKSSIPPTNEPTSDSNNTEFTTL